ncbi:hypothetical protein A9Q84_05385 [Halobacteriovorax marinus]|uniref:N-acetyltransferase domain-containing protein n=1 Tax=Halobacteriovorax marinus TaxID=97084 RepID=A0A1Y5FBB2_9BACT|nr:hypothetical protein A9Q84_05385 [Halobacteriovorax marinus]
MEFIIRSAIRSDSDILLKWRNHSSVNKNSFSTESIDECDHNRWFTSKLNDSKCFMYIAEIENVACGVVRYDLDDTGHEATVSITVSPDFQGKGLGSKLLDTTEKRLLEEVKVEKIIAKVLFNNSPSRKIFERSSFTNKYLTLEKEV